MILNYKVGRQDFQDFAVYYALHRPAYKWSIACLCLLVPALMLALTPIVFSTFAHVTLLRWLVISLAASAFWILTVPARYRAMVRRRVARQDQDSGHLVGEYSLELRDDGLYLRKDHEQDLIEYPVITQLVEDNGRVYVFLGESGVLIIPEGAFVEDSQKQAFLRRLRGKCG